MKWAPWLVVFAFIVACDVRGASTSPVEAHSVMQDLSSIGIESYWSRLESWVLGRWYEHLPPRGSSFWGDGATKFTVSVRFEVDRLGNIRSVRLAQSSGNATADKAAIEAFTSASPVPRPPRVLFEGGVVAPLRLTLTAYN